ncbi:MAG: hydroxyacylglutathione hydrolase [Rhodocyclaceae bacterium]|jgi:hydroxyacylglutathione hydrolase|nr:Hydroxyacylglutathione hydrolase GloB [Rhodocyclaceae bacterium]MBZ0145711.1 hydroxyacylglutathione hydrolase [Rhodocyclaceae bacterium]MCC6879325.1 hydroxyacylglutathione hydrolase [Rhodocyclaceae bacterium]MCL4682757.1 hydroxyacylglutathione hydrolase [Rhodocyclaceae bacterium]
MDIHALRAFDDNYIWLLRQGRHVVVVDPGDEAPVLRYLEAERAGLAAILLTHHHGDHSGGVAALLGRHPAPVFGPANETIAGVSRPLREGDRVDLPDLGGSLRVIDVPGHTRGHVAYYGHGALFCGDTLFACGCGRLFEGTAAQMWASLGKLAALPADTRVYCAHEYTQANIRFALAVEPGNEALQARAARVAEQRAQDQATVPFALAEELATNPFLRSAIPAVAAAAERHCGATLDGPSEVFAALREWRNGFR